MHQDVQDIDRIDEDAAPVEAEAEDQVTEDQPETEDPEPKPDEAQKTVPLAALHEEREKRKEESRRNALLEERFNALMAKLDQPKEVTPEPDPEPDPEDFGGQLLHKLTRLEKWQLDQQEAAKAQQAAQQQRAQLNEVLRQVTAQTKAFTAQTPDYPDAYQFYRERRANQLEVLGVPAHVIDQQINREEIDFMNRAAQAGESAPALLYKYATTLGYSPAAAAQPAPQPGAKKEPPRSVSSMAGKPTGGKMTAKQLMEMPEAEYHQLLKQDPAKVRAILDGAA